MFLLHSALRKRTREGRSLPIVIGAPCGTLPKGNERVCGADTMHNPTRSRVFQNVEESLGYVGEKRWWIGLEALEKKGNIKFWNLA